MLKALWILIAALLLAGCAKTPLIIRVVDFETHEPLVSVSLNASYPSMFEFFVPRIEDATTDHDGSATLRIARHKERSLYVVARRNDRTFSHTIYLSPDFIDSAITHYHKHLAARELTVPLPRRSPPSESLEFKLPDGYRGFVGIAWIQDSSTWCEFVGVVEVRIESNETVALLESRTVSDPVSFPRCQFVFEAGESIQMGRNRDTPPQQIVGESLISHRNNNLIPSRGALADGARIELSGSRGDLYWFGSLDEWDRDLGNLVDIDLRASHLEKFAPIEGARISSTRYLTHTPE